ncbi:hypothetical protein [Nitrincola tibetensis]|uniref:hypothetical protein n=1 Tax=Nitrincola tibetensis TaxID=2219697 RepID=UPI0019615576|nr:hypothetical protein [Nitrincola tibetensis]
MAAQLAATQADLATLSGLSAAGDAANADALASEVASLNSALVAAQTQMQSKLDQAVASINVELVHLQDQINALDGDEALELVLALQAAFADAEAKIAVLEAFIESAEAADLASALESEVAALYAALSDNVATLNSSLNALQASLQANIDQVSNDLSAALNAAIADLQAQINGLNTESATAADLSELAAQLAATQADLATLASLSAAGDAANADALASEVVSLNSTLVTAQTQMQSKLDQAVASINVELANLQDQINALEGDQALELVLALQAAFADAEAKIAVLEAFIASAEAADLASALESEVAALYAALSDNVATLNSSLNALQASLQANIDQVSNDLSAALNAAIADLQAQIDGLNTESATVVDLSALAAQLASTQADLATLSSLSSADDAEILATLDASLLALQTSLVTYIDQVSEDLLSSLNSSFNYLQTQISGLENTSAADLSELAAQLASTQADLAALSTLSAAGDAEILATLDASLLALQTSLVTYIDQVSDDLLNSLNSNFNYLQTQITGLENTSAADLSELAAQLTSTQADLATLASLSAAGDTANAQALAAEVASLTLELAALETRLENSIIEMTSDLSASLNAAIVDLQAQINGLKTESATAADLSALAAQLAATQADLADLQTLSAAGDAANAADLATEVASLTSALESLETRLQDSIDQVSSNLTSALNAAISDLQAQIDGLSTDNGTAAGDLEALTEEIETLKQEIADLKLASGIDTGLTDTLDDLQEQITGLQSQIDDLKAALEALQPPTDPFEGDTLVFTVAELFGSNGTASVSIIAEALLEVLATYDASTITIKVTEALTVAQATALSQAGLVAGADKVEYDIRDYATTVQAALANPDQSLALVGAGQVVAIGNELNNTIDMAVMTSDINLRVELDDGNDTYFAGRGDETIVGGQGADTIYLTHRDTSADTVVYQSILDGQVLPNVLLSFSTNEQDYREGSVLTVSVNGLSYSYTVEKDQTVTEALEALAAELRQSADVQGVVLKVDLDVDTKVADLDIFASGSVLNVSGGSTGTEAIVNAGLKTQIQVAFSSDAEDYPANTNGTNTTEFTRYISVTISGIVISAEVVAGEPADSVAALVTAINAARLVNDESTLVSGSVDHNPVYLGDIIAEATASDAVLTLIANSVGEEDGATFDVSEATITVPGVQQEVQVEFSKNDADYFDGGKLRVTIEGALIEVDMVAGDAKATIESLRQAIVDQELTSLESVRFGLTEMSVKPQSRTGLSDNIRSFSANDLDLSSATGIQILQAGEGFFRASGHGSLEFKFSLLNNEVYDDVYALVDAINAILDSDENYKLTASYNSEFNALDFVSSSGGFSGIISESFLTFKGKVVDGSVITLVSASEGEDTLSVSASLDYPGEAQQATLELNNSQTGKYADYTFDNDGQGPDFDRAAEVYFEDGKAWITITPVNAEGVRDTSNAVKVSAEMGKDAEETHANLVAAINEKINGVEILGEPPAPDPILSELLIGAELSGNGITLTAKENGKQTFEISDITLDYQGVKQIATASFTTSDAAYYDGGKIALVVKLSEDKTVTFEVPMKANEGPALETLNDLKALLDAAINDANHEQYIGDVIGAVDFNQDSGEFTLTSKESVKEAFTIEEATISIEPVQQQATASFSSDEADYYEGGSIGLTVNGKSYVQEMLGSTSEPALLFNFYNHHHHYDAFLTKDYLLYPMSYFTLTIDGNDYDSHVFQTYVQNMFEVQYGHIRVEHFLVWLESLNGINNAEVVDGQNQIKITPASDVQVNFTGYLEFYGQNSYFFLWSGNPDSIIFQPEESIITSTLEALKAQIEADIAQDDDDSFGLESITLNGSTFTLTAKDAEDGYGEINITDVFKTMPAQSQITEVDFSGVLPQSVLDGEQPEVSLGIAGTQITAKAGIDDNATVINLAQALIDARDGVFETFNVTQGIVEGTDGEYFALIGEQPLSADDALSFERIEGTLTINGTEVVIDFMPTQASDGAKTGSSVQDFIDYLNSFPLVGFVELINGVIAIAPVVNLDGPTTIDANLSFNVQTDGYAEADYSNAFVDLTGAEAVAFEPAEPAALTIDFFYTGTPTSFTNFDIRLNVNDGPLLQAQGVIAAGSSLADIAIALNASLAFSGSVVFEAVGSDQLIARTVETGAEAKLSFVSASLFTDVGAGTGVANNSPVNGKDEVLAEDAKPASVLLTEFANLKETAVLKEGDYDVALSINGQSVTTEFNATGDATVAEYLAFIESALQGVANVELTADGLQITTLETGNQASIEIAAGGLSLTTFAVPVAAIADSVGKVEVDGTTLILTGKNPGPDQMNVDDQGYTYQVIDPELSRVQVIDLNFSNSQFDNVSTTPKGTLISVTVDGIMSSVKLWDATDPQIAEGDNYNPHIAYVNVAGLTSTRSEVIVAALKAQMILDHGLSPTSSESQLGAVLQGFVNIATGEFEESANSNSLRLVSGEFGPNSLGSIAEGSISVLVVNAADVTLTNAVSAETVEDGTFVFKDETSSLNVFDKTHEPGSQYAQTGQDAGVINYNDSVDASAEGSDYLLTLLGDNLADFIQGYKSGESLSQLLDQYGINKDYLYDEYELGEYTNTAPDDSFASVTVSELAGLVSGGRTASDYALKAGNYSFIIQIDDRQPEVIEFTASATMSLMSLVDSLQARFRPFGQQEIATVTLTEQGLVITSRDSGENSAVSFLSDTPLFIQSVAMLNGLLDINDQVKEGVAAKDVDQAWVNPGTNHNSDFENASYYGDNPLSGENNEGVQQTHTNPESGYVADTSSPNPNSSNTNQGDGDLFGSDPGKYTDEGLVTDYLNGGNQNGDGVYTSIDNKDLTNIINETEAVEGVEAGELTASDSEDLDIEVVEEGFAEYAWDDSVVAVLSIGISGPDVIHHFQVDHDLIALEGDLLQSTVSGEVEYLSSFEFKAGFDLSEMEFGLISAAHNQAAHMTVAAADLTNAEKVADLLNDLFNFNSVTDNGEINTSIFAVAAADNADVTAIWAHQQSSTDDSSLESYEMKLLALVNTTGGELTAENFLPQPSEQLLG